MTSPRDRRLVESGIPAFLGLGALFVLLVALVAALSPTPPAGPAAGRGVRADVLGGAVRSASWLPSGTGVWLHEWNRTEGGDARKVVARAQAAGLRTLYVRTGTKKGGFDGGPVLDQLLPATRGTAIDIVAWDFPLLRDPAADASRLAAAALHVPPGSGTPRVRAVAPDIETAAEGTAISAANVAAYLTELRRLLPAEIPILTTVPWPSERRTTFPYAAVADGSDALLPQAYWYGRDPVVVTAASVGLLAPLGKPVLPIGQGYDGRIDAPTLRTQVPLQQGVISFLTTAHELKVRAVSLWSWQTMHDGAWESLAAASRSFD